ncbi:MAG: NUDIX domain-containing protein [Patescibacteria group bacterium]
MEIEYGFTCDLCEKPATWIRRTQFAGTHPFCTEHAKEEKDFGTFDSSYFFWKELSVEEKSPMKRERNKAVPAVYLILERDDGCILLMRRCNTGYQDGNYNLPSGHVEDGELPKAAMVREAKEEIGIDVAQEDLEFVHASYRPKHDETGNRGDLFFCTKKWSGEVINAEPGKCDDLKWTDPDDLPHNTTPHVRKIIEDIWEGITYSEIDTDFLKNERVYLLDQ